MRNSMGSLAKLVPQITYSFKAYPGQGQSVGTLKSQLEDLGNKIIEINDDYILCEQFSEVSDSWGCILCLEENKILFVDSQEELCDHLNLVHEGWVISEQGFPYVTS